MSPVENVPIAGDLLGIDYPISLDEFGPSSVTEVCRYAALPNVRMSITDSGRMAISGQYHMATAGQNLMSAHKPAPPASDAGS